MQIKKSFLAAICIFVTGCGSHHTAPDTTLEGPRTIILDGIEEPLTENDDLSFESWTCYELSKSIRVRVEVGIIKGYEGIGFILFDRTNTGTPTFYTKDNTSEGIKHRWGWGLNEAENFDYEFILNPDGNGLFYNHSVAEDGISGTQRSFKCQPSPDS